MSNFDLKSFTRDNLISGIKNGVFAKEQANIWAVNYFTKGILGEDDISHIEQEIRVWEESKLVSEPVEEPVEDNPDEELIEEEPEEELLEEEDEAVE